MTPDPVALLTELGLGHYAAAIIALVMCIGYAITWIAPLVPEPAPTDTGLGAFVRRVIHKIAGNMLNARNAPAAAAPIPTPNNGASVQ